MKPNSAIPAALLALLPSAARAASGAAWEITSTRQAAHASGKDAELVKRILDLKTRRRALNRASFDALMRLMKHEDRRVRFYTWGQLERIARRTSVKLQALVKEDPKRRVEGGLLMRVAGVSFEGSDEIWREALRHDDPVIRAAALARPPQPLAKHEAPVLALLDDPDRRVLEAVVLTLCRNHTPLSEKHLPQVLQVIRSKAAGQSNAILTNAATLLARFGEAAFPALRQLLRSEDAAQRRAAVATILRLQNLEKITELSSAVVAAIERLEHNADAKNPRAARWARFDRRQLFQALAVTGADSLTRLLSYAQSEDPVIAKDAKDALIHARVDENKIAELLSSKNPTLRSAGLQIARSKGSPDRLVGLLAPLLYHSDAATREGAIDALSRAQTPRLLPHYYRALYEAPAEYRLGIRLLIETCGGNRLRSTDLVVDGLRGALSQERMLALRLVQRMHSDFTRELVAALIACCEHNNPYVRSLAANHLRRAKGNLTVDYCQKLLAAGPTKYTALEIARQMGPTGLPILETALADRQLRTSALRYLAALGAKARPALPKIRELSGEQRLEHSVLVALLSIDPSGEDALAQGSAFVRKVLDDEPARFTEAMQVMGLLGARGAKFVPSAMARVRSAPKQSQLHHLSYLMGSCEKLGPHAASVVPLLLEWLPKPAARMRVISALRNIGSGAHAAIPALLQLAEDPQDRMSTWAMTALWSIAVGADAETTAPVLAAADRIAARKGPTSAAALWAACWPHSKARLLELPKTDRQSSKALAQALQVLARNDPDALLEFAATARARELVCLAAALGEVRQGRERAVVILTELLDLDAHRRPALYALAKLGKIAAPAMKSVQRELKRDPQLIHDATKYFGAVGSTGLPALIAFLKSEEARVRIAAMRALAGLGPAAAPALDTLFGIANSADRNEAAAAINAMVAMGRRGCAALTELDERAVPLIRQHLWSLLGHKDAKVQQRMWTFVSRHQNLRLQTLRSVARKRDIVSGDRQTRQRIVKFAGEFEYRAPHAEHVDRILLDGLFDPEAAVRQSALRAIAKCRATGILPYAASLTRDEDSKVRLHAARMLGAFGADAKPHRASLTPLLEDSDPKVQDAARRALERIPAGR